jgi:hypothetical protein
MKKQEWAERAERRRPSTLRSCDPFEGNPGFNAKVTYEQ